MLFGKLVIPLLGWEKQVPVHQRESDFINVREKISWNGRFPVSDLISRDPEPEHNNETNQRDSKACLHG